MAPIVQGQVVALVASDVRYSSRSASLTAGR